MASKLLNLYKNVKPEKFECVYASSHFLSRLVLFLFTKFSSGSSCRVVKLQQLKMSREKKEETPPPLLLMGTNEGQNWPGSQNSTFLMPVPQAPINAGVFSF